MPFNLYRKTGEEDGLDVVELAKPWITFGGHKNGILLKHLELRGVLDAARNQAPGNDDVHFANFPVGDLLESDGIDHATHRLVIDLKPSTSGNVSLYDVRELWVAIHETWTPVMLRIHPLFMDRQVTEGTEWECKQRLLLDPNRDAGQPIHDIVYLKGGYGRPGENESGWWGPSRLGQYSAVLLFPMVAEYFSKAMLKSLDRYGGETLPPRANRLACEQARG